LVTVSPVVTPIPAENDLLPVIILFLEAADKAGDNIILAILA
jgi:hypothetical protein